MKTPTVSHGVFVALLGRAGIFGGCGILPQNQRRDAAATSNPASPEAGYPG